MKEPYTVFGYLKRAYQYSKMRRTIEKIRDGEDEPLKALLVDIVGVELHNNVDDNSTSTYYQSLKSNLRQVLITPNEPEVGKRRCKLLRKAGYPILMCGEDDYATATVGVQINDRTVFATQLHPQPLPHPWRLTC